MRINYWVLDLMTPTQGNFARLFGRAMIANTPKPRAAELAKWGFDYWDGDRRINYGGYKYIPGRWAPVAKLMIEKYNLVPGSGYWMLVVVRVFKYTNFSFYSCDSARNRYFKYAIENAHQDVKI